MKLARGVAKLSLSTLQSTIKPPDDDDLVVLDRIDYDMLEKTYNIHKYYPQYIHNFDISTPVLRSLIIDKPIYNDANKNVDIDKRKRYNLEISPENKYSQKAYKKECKLEKKLQRLEKKESKMKESKKLLRNKLEDIEKQLVPPQIDSDIDTLETDVEDEIVTEIFNGQGLTSIPLTKDSSNWSENSTTRTSSKSISSRSSTSKPKLSFRFFTKVFPKSPPGTISKQEQIDMTQRINSYQPVGKPDVIIPLQKSQTFDQTKSNFTLKRRLAKKLTRSEQENQEIIEIVTEDVTNGHTGAIERIQYTQSQMVGHGSFGVVFQTQILPTNEIAAMKRVLQDKRFKNRELQIMKLVHHRNIADLKYYFYTNNDKNELYLNLILEFVPETLYKASHYYVSKRLSMPPLEIKLYTYQMFRALNYIHSQGICHRDIKPQNLLINPDSGELKLCDFGSAKILNPSEPNVSYICSRYYRAPELIFGATNYTTKIDVWSAGCVMAELILGQPLFPGESGIDQLVEIIKILGTPTKEQIRNMNPNYMEHKFPQIKPIPLTKIFKKIGNDCILFLIKVLQYSPMDRISSIEALVDGYFDELRNPETKLPNYRKIFSQQFHNSNIANNPAIHSTAANYQLYNNQPDLKDLPVLFDFNERELSVAPELNAKLVPNWAMSGLMLQNGGIKDLSEFVPLNSEEMKVTLE